MTAPRLRAVPESPPRALGLVRVSKERVETTSPEIQRHAITNAAAAAGYEIAGWLEGIDESGSRAHSAWWPRLDQAVASVEAGDYDVILVWKFSRTARHRLRWAVALDRVEAAGGRLESATEQVDTTTSTGRFTRGMLGELNAFEAERIGEVWKETHQRRVRSGRPHTGRPRWGYRYDPVKKLHMPDAEQGPVLADLYRRYVAGESIWTLVKWLNSHGWRTTAGGQWSDHRLRTLLDGGFAAGLFTYRGELHHGIHEPLISRDLWQAYRDARAARRKIPPRVERSPYLLSGLVRCARCGAMMRAYREDPRPVVDNRRGKTYRSKGVRLSWRCGRCPEKGTGPSGYVASWKVEDQVMTYLRLLAGAVDADATEKLLKDTSRVRREVEAGRLAREVVHLEESLVRLAVQHAERPLPAAAYDQSRLALEQRLAAVTASLEALDVDTRRAPQDPHGAARGLLAQWKKLPVASRREVLRGLLECVLVRTGPEPWIVILDWNSKPVWRV